MACVPRYASQIGCAQTPDSSLSARSLRLSCMSFLQTDSRGSNSLPRQGGMYGNYTGLECPGPSDRLLYVLTAGSKPAWSPVAVTVNQSSVAALILPFENQDHPPPPGDVRECERTITSLSLSPSLTLSGSRAGSHLVLNGSHAPQTALRVLQRLA